MKNFTNYVRTFMTTTISEHNKHSWCVNAYHALSANNDGSTKTCCMIGEEYNRLSKTSKEYFIGVKSIKENFDCDAAQTIRDNLSNGIRDNACRLCWQEEDGGRKSKRLRDNEKYLHAIEFDGQAPFTGLAKVELNLGNNCNIKCRTCHPTISSTWMKEAFDLDHAPLGTTYKTFSAGMKKYHQHYDDDSSFWPDLIENLETIKQFDFYGGEPFLSKKMWEILRICVERGYAKDIELHYNTNGTVWPKDIELWKHFRSVNISFSIDGIGERFEYMRYPANWEEVRANMQKAVDFNTEHNNLSLSWCMTLSSLNIYYLPELLDEYYKNWTSMGFYLNLVHNPNHFNISKMSPEAKQAALEQLNNIPKEYEGAWYQLPGIIGFMMGGEYDPITWKYMLKMIDKHDEYREQDFAKTFSEFSKAIR